MRTSRALLVLSLLLAAAAPLRADPGQSPPAAFLAFVSRRGSEFGLSRGAQETLWRLRLDPSSGKPVQERVRGEAYDRLVDFFSRVPTGAAAEPYLTQSLTVYLGCQGLRNESFEDSLFIDGADGSRRLSPRGKALLLDILTAQDGLMLRQSGDAQPRRSKGFAARERILRAVADDEALKDLSGSFDADKVPTGDGREQLDLAGLRAAGMDGSGAVIGVMDTGLDTTHPDFKGRVAAYYDYTGKGGADRVGHGTHVTGLAAGSGSVSEGRYMGAAPKSRITELKIIDSPVDWATGTVTQGRLEDRMVRAMRDAAALPPGKRPDVLNISMGAVPDSSAVYDRVNQLANRLTIKDNILVVASAGNNGPNAATIGSPGSAEYALTVSGVDKLGDVPSTASRGPVLEYETAFSYNKPELATIAGDRGAEVIGPRSAQAKTPAYAPSAYWGMAGTSQAAGLASGAAAAVIGYLKTHGLAYRAVDVKAVMMESAHAPEYSPEQVGAGVLDGKALSALVLTRATAGVPVGSVACMLAMRLTTPQRDALAGSPRYKSTPLGLLDRRTGHLMNTDRDLRRVVAGLPKPAAAEPPAARLVSPEEE